MVNGNKIEKDIKQILTKREITEQIDGKHQKG